MQSVDDVRTDAVNDDSIGVDVANYFYRTGGVGRFVRAKVTEDFGDRSNSFPAELLYNVAFLALVAKLSSSTPKTAFVPPRSLTCLRSPTPTSRDWSGPGLPQTRRFTGRSTTGWTRASSIERSRHVIWCLLISTSSPGASGLLWAQESGACARLCVVRVVYVVGIYIVSSV
jgi:hypothetical protein